jgi:hypothetical protein
VNLPFAILKVEHPKMSHKWKTALTPAFGSWHQFQPDGALSSEWHSFDVLDALVFSGLLSYESHVEIDA